MGIVKGKVEAGRRFPGCQFEKVIDMEDISSI